MAARDLGPLVGGLWALSAGLLALLGGLLAVNSTKLESKSQEQKRTRNIAILFADEIQNIWIYLQENKLSKLLDDLVSKIDQTQQTQQLPFYVEGDWLQLYRLQPNSVASLPSELVIEVTAHYSKLLGFIRRINWANREWKQQDAGSFRGAMAQSREDLSRLKDEARKIVAKLREAAGRPPLANFP